MNGLHKAINRLLDYARESRDAFDNDLVRVTRNDADLAAHYRATPERFRLRRNGERVLYQYLDLSNYAYFSDQEAGDEDVYVLFPDGGDTMDFRTAERFRYTVNFISEVTQAVALSDPLTNDGDVFELGLDTSRNRDRSDGYFARQTHAHDSDEIDLFARRNGNVLGTPRTVTLREPTTTFSRWENDYNWYNVGKSKWRRTVTLSTDDESVQVNDGLGTVTTEPGDANAGDGGRGPLSGNGQIVYHVETAPETTGLEVYVGSSSYTTLGGNSGVIKDKGAEAYPLIVPQSGAWVPLFAIRVKDGRDLVNTDLQNLTVTAGSGKALTVACAPSNVLDTDGNELTDDDFATPPEMSERNSAIEVSPEAGNHTGSEVAQFPDADGNPVTATQNPGGYQLQFDTSRQTGSGNNSSTRSGDLEQKHGILGGDYAVVLAYAQNTDDYGIAYNIEMDE
jgi:hypothetical protein